MFCFGQKRNAAQERYRRGSIGVLTSYVGFLFSATLMVRRWHPQGWHLYLAALLPSIPIFCFLYIAGRYLREEKDEFQRDLFVRCLLWGTATVMAVEMFTSFLRTFGWTGNLPPFADYYVLGLTMIVAKFTYKFQNRVPADE